MGLAFVLPLLFFVALSARTDPTPANQNFVVENVDER
jgi:hypothetical protein